MSVLWGVNGDVARVRNGQESRISLQFQCVKVLGSPLYLDDEDNTVMMESTATIQDHFIFPLSAHS